LDRFASVRAVTLHGCLLPLSTRQRTAPRATSACRPRGSHFLAGVNPVKRRANLRDRRPARDRSGSRLSRSRIRRGFFFEIEPSRPRHVISVTASIRGYASRRGVRAERAPASGTRKLSYSTSPRLTALPCSPSGEHERDNSEKKPSLTADRVSARCSVDGRPDGRVRGFRARAPARRIRR
jgi:hypothetical protein